MAVALEAADLVLIALFLFLLAFLHATKWTIAPLLSSLHSALGWVPGVGDLIRSGENAVTGGLNSAIGGTERMISILWRGITWSFEQMVKGLADFAHGSEAALSWLAHTGMPALIRTALAPVATAANTAHALALAASADVVRLRTTLEARIAATARATLSTLRSDIQSADQAIRRDLGAEINGAKALARTEIAKGVAGAEQAATTALQTLKAAEDAAVASARAVGAGVATEIGAAAHGAEAELGSLGRLGVDELERLLRSKELGTLAGLLAAVPILNALVQALEAESGLSTRECRQKVKGICGVSPQRWEKLLALLALETAWPGLEPLARELVRLTREVEPAIRELAGV